MTDKESGNSPGNKSGDNKKLTPPTEDDELWREAMADVVPLPEKPEPAEKCDPRQEIRRIRQKLREKEPPETVPGRHRSKSGGISPPGLDRRTDDRLRRGLMTIDGRLDLHGLTQGAALAALEEFIHRSHERGRRCVLVITGKGARRNQEEKDTPWYEPQPGILRERVQEWLRGGALAEKVLRFYPARPEHGGEGAFYILLRRKR